jgi:hypothetical protein
MTSFENTTYASYDDSLQFAFDSKLDILHCAYCGQKTQGLEHGCPVCSRKNCKACIERFNLPADIATESGTYCPLPRMCAKLVFEDSIEVAFFGSFGKLDANATRRYDVDFVWFMEAFMVLRVFLALNMVHTAHIVVRLTEAPTHAVFVVCTIARVVLRKPR